MHRRERHLPPGQLDPAGIMIRRNPGVALVWTSRTFAPFRVSNGVLFDIGEPITAEWYAEGRAATTEEIRASIDSGLPALHQIAEEEGPDAVAELTRRYDNVIGQWAS
jgi:hypothetical protein